MIILIPHSERKRAIAHADQSIECVKVSNIDDNSLLDLKCKSIKKYDESMLAAYQRYDGVLYREINFSDKKIVDLQYWLPRIWVINPYNGVHNLTEDIPNYNERFNHKYNNMSLKRFWERELKDISIKEEIYSLLPSDHTYVVKSWPTIKITHNNYQTNSTYENKAVKGRLIESLLSGKDLNTSMKVNSFSLN